MSRPARTDRRPAHPTSEHPTAPSRAPLPPGLGEALDEWAFSNDPTRFRVPLETKVEALARNGTAEPRPWADTYWPTYQDGINARWQHTGDLLRDLSPAEKFDAAFNGWDPERVRGHKPYRAEYGHFHQPGDEEYYRNLGPFARDCSMRFGNRRTREAAAAGKLLPDGSAKSGNEKEDFGGIETWFGLCHAWTPAAILEREPMMPVEHNGIRFEVSDIKALLIACYNQTAAILIGSRNEDRDIALDDRGRAEKADARDVNPGAFHLLLCNLIGRDKRAFAEDRTANYEVWNQPVQEYRVTMLEKIPRRRATQLARLSGVWYRHNPKAELWYHVQLEVDYITESAASIRPNAESDEQERTDPYEYILECDAEGNVIGGEWLATSRAEHPDFLWLPLHAGAPISPYVSLDQVHLLLKKSREDVEQRGEKIDLKWSVRLDAGEVLQVGTIEVKVDGVLELIMTGRGDIDVYTRAGSDPEIRGDGTEGEFDFMMYGEGSNERGTLDVSAGEVIHVALRGFVDHSAATLIVRQQ
ncbi:MAG: hypothetical protein KC501_06150 [Myxococcales bacterium]|nr:hypothetical protein [Myxococcales bacterium]